MTISSPHCRTAARQPNTTIACQLVRLSESVRRSQAAIADASPGAPTRSPSITDIAYYLHNASMEGDTAKLLGDPAARGLRLGFTGTAHRYNAEIRTAFTIAADGTTVLCFELSGITLREATQIAEACEEIEEWSIESFRVMVEEVLGLISGRLQ